MKKLFLKTVLSLAAFIAFANIAFSQSDDLILANKLYEKFSYSKAIPLYEKVIEKKSTLQALERLADCYRRINDYKNAETWYEKVVADTSCGVQQHLMYAQVLMSLGKTEKARKHMQTYLAQNPGDARANSAIASIDIMDSISKDKKLWTVRKITALSSPNSDITPAVYKNGIVFSSAREDGGGKTQALTGKPYHKLFYAEGRQTEFGAPIPFAPEVASKYNDGPVAFNADASEMFITRNNIEDGKVKMDQNRVVRLKLFSTQQVNGKWSELKSFQYNSETHSCAHPYLSADGKKLFFASDMPGGFGGMDIWYCNKTETGWDTPKNLGASINTRGNELFPSVDDKGNLIYASNGMGGLGGLDIFTANASGDGSFSTPQNAGAPMNSSYDDFGAVYDKKNLCGYFASNRDSKNENDDLYMYKRTCVNLDGLVYDKATGEPISMADVKIVEAGTDKDVVKTDANGKFSYCLAVGKSYELVSTKEAYRPSKVQINNVGDEDMETKIPMEKAPMFAIEGRVYLEEDKSSIVGIPVQCENLITKEKREMVTDAQGMYHFDLDAETDYRITCSKEKCADNNFVKTTRGLKVSAVIRADIGFFCEGDIIKIDNIYYDLAKWNIRPDAAKELDKLVTILKKYPNMSIELGSHTDCRASAKYNMDLSQKRAKSAVEYVDKNGIDGKRLAYKGYGESELVNKCECEGEKKVPCTEEEHQQNRRTEFKIISIK